MLDLERFDAIADRIYGAVESEMTEDDVQKVLEEVCEEFEVTDNFDVALVGVLLGDVWRPHAGTTENDENLLDEEIEEAE